jgi:hypothetical protein
MASLRTTQPLLGGHFASEIRLQNLYDLSAHLPSIHELGFIPFEIVAVPWYLGLGR